MGTKLTMMSRSISKLWSVAIFLLSKEASHQLMAFGRALFRAALLLRQDRLGRTLPTLSRSLRLSDVGPHPAIAALAATLFERSHRDTWWRTAASPTRGVLRGRGEPSAARLPRRRSSARRFPKA